MQSPFIKSYIILIKAHDRSESAKRMTIIVKACARRLGSRASPRPKIFAKPFAVWQAHKIIRDVSGSRGGFECQGEAPGEVTKTQSGEGLGKGGRRPGSWSACSRRLLAGSRGECFSGFTSRAILISFACMRLKAVANYARRLPSPSNLFQCQKERT